MDQKSLKVLLHIGFCSYFFHSSILSILHLRMRELLKKTMHMSDHTTSISASLDWLSVNIMCLLSVLELLILACTDYL